MDPAKIVSDSDHIWWHCPNCQQRLAEIIGTRVVIRIRDRIVSLPTEAEPDQVCWRCGTTSVLTKEKAA